MTGLIIVMSGAGIRGAPRVGDRAQGGIVDKVEGEAGGSAQGGGGGAENGPLSSAVIGGGGGGG